MFDIIVACTENFGIGRAGCMAWHCREELKLFRDKTRDAVLIMGRKTVENLPELKNRTIICVSHNKKLDMSKYPNQCILAHDVKTAVDIASTQYPDKKVFVAGGGQIYRQCFNDLLPLINQAHISFMKIKADCDTYLSFNMSEWVIDYVDEYNEFVHYVMKHTPNGENQYLQLINDVKYNGTVKNGRNGKTHSKFTKHLSFDLREGFPLLTTKKMFTRGIIEELLFFLRGETDSKKLEAKKVNIWKGNTNRKFLDSIGMTKRNEGIMGPMYGAQWRHFNGEYNEETGKMSGGVDQLKYVIDTIRKSPDSRRILMTDFNPSQVDQGVLYPCHSIIIQFYVNDGCLDMFCYIRSSDLFLGLPFNIASSGMLLTLIAKICNLIPRQLNITLGDAHIYEEHFPVIDKQTSRQPYTFPTLEIKKELNEVDDIETLQVSDFVIHNYRHHPAIKAKMIA